MVGLDTISMLMLPLRSSLRDQKQSLRTSGSKAKISPFACPHPPSKDKVVLSDIAPFFDTSGFPIGLCYSEPNSQFSDMESLFTKDVLKKVDGTEASRTKVAIVKFVVMCQQAHRAIA